MSLYGISYNLVFLKSSVHVIGSYVCGASAAGAMAKISKSNLAAGIASTQQTSSITRAQHNCIVKVNIAVGILLCGRSDHMLMLVLAMPPIFSDLLDETHISPTRDRLAHQRSWNCWTQEPDSIVVVCCWHAMRHFAGS
jgi:hypothetical protein